MTDSRPPLTVLLSWLVSRGRPLILEHFSADSCLASTRIAVEVLEAFGYRARPLPGSLRVFNPAATQVLRAGETLSNEHHEAGARMVEVPGERGVWVDEQGGSGYGSHLVCLVAVPAGQTVATMPGAEAVVLDLSLDQAARPKKDIDVAASMFGLSSVERALAGIPFGFFTNGCAVTYQANGDTTFRRAHDWKSADSRRMAGKFIRILTDLREEAS